MSDQTINNAKRHAIVMQHLAEFQLGQVLALNGCKVKIVHIDPPNDYRQYALLELVPVGKGCVPTRTMARVDERGLNFQIPKGWR